MKTKTLMKILPRLFLYFVLPMVGWNSGLSAPALESPDCIEQYKHPSPVIGELAAMLKDKRFKSFYKKMEQDALTFKVTTQDNVHTELKEKVWHCYLAALAPVFTFKTYRETEPDVDMDDAGDLNCKSMVCGHLEKYITLVRNSGEMKPSLKKTVIRNLLLPYYACILKQFKNAGEKNPYRIVAYKDLKDMPAQTEESRKRSEEQVKKLKQLSMRELKILINNVAWGESFIEARNVMVEDEVKHLEKVFMELLVSEFPGQYSKVEEFLLQSGYTREDIPNLIDRTVGREPQTDFLYQGRHRVEHDRLLKKKGKK